MIIEHLKMLTLSVPDTELLEQSPNGNSRCPPPPKFRVSEGGQIWVLDRS